MRTRIFYLTSGCCALGKKWFRFFTSIRCEYCFFPEGQKKWVLRFSVFPLMTKNDFFWPAWKIFFTNVEVFSYLSISADLNGIWAFHKCGTHFYCCEIFYFTFISQSPNSQVKFHKSSKHNDLIFCRLFYYLFRKFCKIKQQLI
jgi:hypothetical protein